jgi:hypothetical protein
MERSIQRRMPRQIESSQRSMIGHRIGKAWPNVYYQHTSTSNAQALIEARSPFDKACNPNVTASSPLHFANADRAKQNQVTLRCQTSSEGRKNTGDPTEMPI